MRAEFFSGSINWDNHRRILIPDETCIPKALVLDGDIVIESHAFQNGVDRLENRPFTENTMLVERRVRRQDGELIDWACVLYPEISPETRSSLEEIIRDNSNRPTKALALHREMYRRIPKLKVVKGGQIELSPGPYKISISKHNDNSLGKELTNTRTVFAIPFTSKDFIGNIANSGNYISSTNFIMHKPIDEVDDELHHLIQSGLFTEKGIRSFVDIQFNIDKI